MKKHKVQHRVLYVCPLAHLTGHPPFECTKESRIMKEHGVDVELLTFCGVHNGFPVEVAESKVMSDNSLFKAMRRKYITQWMLRVFEYSLTILKAVVIAKGSRAIYLRDAEPFPHIVHIINACFRRKWVISSTGGLYTTGEGVSPLYKLAFQMSLVNWSWWYNIGRRNISYSVQNVQTGNRMKVLYGDNVTVVPLGHKAHWKEANDVARKELSIPEGNMVVLVLGANHTGKDSEVVFKALREIDNVTLIHASPTKQSMGIHPMQYASDYGVTDKVIMIDRQIGNEYKKLLFGVADWSILSYKKIFSSTTSMLWESMAYDVPVIASTGNELEQLVKYWNLGLLFEAGDGEDLARIIEVAKNTVLKDCTLSNRKDFLDYYSEDKWFERTMELIKGVTNDFSGS